jgi:hypothetical protein
VRSHYSPTFPSPRSLFDISFEYMNPVLETSPAAARRHYQSLSGQRNASVIRVHSRAIIYVEPTLLPLATVRNLSDPDASTVFFFPVTPRHGNATDLVSPCMFSAIADANYCGGDTGHRWGVAGIVNVPQEAGVLDSVAVGHMPHLKSAAIAFMDGSQATIYGTVAGQMSCAYHVRDGPWIESANARVSAVYMHGLGAPVSLRTPDGGLFYPGYSLAVDVDGNPCAEFPGAGSLVYVVDGFRSFFILKKIG